MKRLITVLVTCMLLLTSNLIAVPASPHLETTIIDDTQLMIKVNGDEFCHWVTTEDGYTLLKDTQGYYQYAVNGRDGSLKLSGIRANNLGTRSITEVEFLKKNQINVGYNPTTIMQIRKKSVLSQSAKGIRMGGFPSTGTRKLLMILANFSDTGTTYNQGNFNSYMNQVNYNSTGSFRDYYLENSYGKLTVNTTVQTWVQLSKPRSYYGPQAKWSEFAYDAIIAANAAGVDFSQYDNNDDGVIDGVAVIHQGFGQEETGNTSDIWSHNYDLRYVGYNLTVDGKTAGPYTCQPEKSGSGMSSIGVMCHEFGHNLGLPDFYDTDYATGGSYIGTGNWDAMAGGSYNNYGKTPAHHNGWSKNFLSWTNVTTLSTAAKITVRNSVTNTDLFRINTASSNEYFLIENRQKAGFDSYLPGSGLIIYHVDGNYVSSHTNNNDINATSHQGLYPKVASGSINSAGCPFPGNGNNTSFTDATAPNSKSWAGTNTNKPMTNIVLSSGVVTFDFMGGGTSTPDPTVNITSPTANSSITLGSVVGINASTTGNNISKVDFYIDGVLKGTDTSSPYQYSWLTTGYTSGTHAIKTIVTNTQNLTAENSISVSLMNGTPQVQITSPANNAQFNMGSTVNIAATATDPAKSVSKVEFYIDGILKGTDTSSPYQYSWVTTGSSSGTHAIKAIVTDNQNLTAENSISVSLMNGTPQVQITSPANNAQFNMGSTVNIAATATDQAKLVSKVDFYIDGVLKGTDTSSPYQYSWVTTGSSSGTHAIKTIVTDDQNLTAENSISVTLNNSTETIILSEGFENQFPPANWTADTAPRCWYQSIEFPHLGNKCAAVEWNHTMTAGASITTPALALPAVLNKNYVLEFWWIDKDYWSSKEKNTKNKIKTDGYDFTYCEISTNGTSWTEVAKIGGGAAMTQFVKVTVDLTPYQGSAVKIRWRDTNSGNDNSVGTGLDDVKITLQTGSSIDQNLSIENLICSNYPNPFNPETTISFNNLQEGMVNLTVFNSRGEIVEELVNRNLQKGIHSIKFDGSNLNSGIYFYRLNANQKSYTGKMMLLK